jgi:alpha-amylase/alpha-mannosidase (GH57 family)
MNRYVCIHGHFYQPPRENAWLESIEAQPTASPYHDWNEKVTAECYWPNCASQILDSSNRIVQITNNYAKISFDFGPTLLSWLKVQSPDVYESILEADKISIKTFSGHGSAIAHAYNHIIMPLANRRDKYTQIVWGLRDFESRFKRHAEGMWLPETAVDLETLDIMAELGVKFTIISPAQAASVRSSSSMDWRDVTGRIDTTVPYLINLPSGRRINVFFYQGSVAHAVAFRNLLDNGEEFARALVNITPEVSVSPRLGNIATDGETYGHHHRFGEMALAYAVQFIEKQGLSRITNYAEFLELCPPKDEVQIIENTSWSCVHGVERWRSDCGCSDHFHPGWNQSWRALLRESMDWLRDTVNPLFEKKARAIFRDPWKARDDYIFVMNDRSPDSIQYFTTENVIRALTKEERVEMLKLMELQRHAMQMYTSCGWFFDDLARIESVQIMQYAGRVAQLAQELFGDTTEAQFLAHLEKARSNRSDYGDGRQIYNRFVSSSKLDLKKVAGHYAVRSSLNKNTGIENIYSYLVKIDDMEGFMCGQTDINFGRITVTSVVTGESLKVEFMVVYHEKGTTTAGIGHYTSEQERSDTIAEISASCAMNDFESIENLLQQKYSDSIFTISSLFRDTQYQLLDKVIEDTAQVIQPLFYPELRTYAAVTPLVNDIDNPLPETFRPLVELTLNLTLRNQLSAHVPDRELVLRLVNDAKLWQISLEIDFLGYIFGNSIYTKMQRFISNLEDTALIDELIDLITLAKSLPFVTSFSRTQYLYYKTLQTQYLLFVQRGNNEWIGKFRRLGDLLGINLL